MLLAHWSLAAVAPAWYETNMPHYIGRFQVVWCTVQPARDLMQTLPHAYAGFPHAYAAPDLMQTLPHAYAGPPHAYAAPDLMHLIDDILAFDYPQVHIEVHDRWNKGRGLACYNQG